MDEVSEDGSELGGDVSGQRIAPLYASTPGEPCSDIAPRREYGGAIEKSYHSVQSNERFLSDYDVESRARALSSSPKEPDPRPFLLTVREVYPIDVLKMVDNNHQWADPEWERMESALFKEWTSAYEDAETRGLDPQRLREMLINRLLEYQNLGITNVKALCYVSNSVIDRLEVKYYQSALGKQITTNDLSAKVDQDGYQDRFPASVVNRKKVSIASVERKTMEARTRQFLKELPPQAPVKIAQSPHSTVPDCGDSPHALRISSLENVVEKLTATINEMVAKAETDQPRWHGTQQSEDRLWETIHRMERDSNSQDRTIQKLERSDRFNDQKSVAHQGQLNELKSTVRSQEQQLAAQCTDIRQLRESVRSLKRVQISQQNEFD
ncbi:MAG: hypothetical protein GY782_04095, partial [Gammaproteobacteria bacterium]|nr:hypothetical protein [Gammaproteobacteria bacterium]